MEDGEIILEAKTPGLKKSGIKLKLNIEINLILYHWVSSPGKLQDLPVDGQCEHRGKSRESYLSGIK